MFIKTLNLFRWPDFLCLKWICCRMVVLKDVKYDLKLVSTLRCDIQALTSDRTTWCVMVKTCALTHTLSHTHTHTNSHTHTHPHTRTRTRTETNTRTCTHMIMCTHIYPFSLEGVCSVSWRTVQPPLDDYNHNWWECSYNLVIWK